MNVINFAETPSLITHYLAQLRDVNVQNDRLRFRTNIERISFCIAFEISKILSFTQTTVQTPLGKSAANVMEEKPVIAFVLRAGLSMHTGFLNAFDEADNCFISAYREEGNIDQVKAHIEYLASPNLDDRTVILVDPMLATGGSLVGGYKAMLRNGTPSKLHVACIVAAQQGINFITQKMPEIDTLWVASIDEGLNDRAYIVPGFGDAGDLAFGGKV